MGTEARVRRRISCREAGDRMDLMGDVGGRRMVVAVVEDCEGQGEGEGEGFVRRGVDSLGE